MAKNKELEQGVQGETAIPSSNGAAQGVQADQEPEPIARPGAVFSREAFEDMRADEDMAPSLEEPDETYIPLGRPPKGYFVVHPSPTFELKYAFTHDFRKSEGKNDPYLVMRSAWPYFPAALLRVKRLVLCQAFTDEALHTWFWLADWYETGETPSEFHKSVDRVISRGRQGWIQALYTKGIYQIKRWPEARLGEMPEPVWPDRDMFEIVQETFADRIIATPDHDLVRAIGEDIR